MNYKIVKNSKSEPKNFSRLCTFKFEILKIFTTVTVAEAIGT
jgi:hypothetical protein